MVVIIINNSDIVKYVVKLYIWNIKFDSIVLIKCFMVLVI